MNRMAVVMLTALFGGCYTQLQVANNEATTNPPYVPPAPIVIIEPYYPPYPPPHPCPPRPSPPVHPIIVQPTEQIPTPSAENNRIRTDGSTRDEDNRADRGGNTEHRRR